MRYVARYAEKLWAEPTLRYGSHCFPHLLHEEHADVLAPWASPSINEEHVPGGAAVSRAVGDPHLGPVDLEGRPVGRSDSFRRHAEHIGA